MVGQIVTVRQPNWHQQSGSDPSPVEIEPNRDYKPPRKPHALCLTVFLSSDSFLGFKDEVTGKPEITDVKINVYFNGAFCASYFVPRRYHGENYAMTEHIVRFTGRRIGQVIEKPWIIVPSGQKPDGSRRRYRKDEAASAGAQQRWKDISDALMTEADKNGRNEKGERPICGEYLESLAQLSMPTEVEDMQKAGGKKLGIFDVVIIWGKGSTEDREASFIVESTHMRNEGFTATNPDQPIDGIPVQSVPKTTDSPITAPKSKDIVSAKSSNGGSPASTVFPLSLTPTQNTTPNISTNPATPSPLKTYPALQPEEPRKPKQTLEEQFKSISAAYDLNTKTEYSPMFMNHARTTRSSTAPTAGSLPLSSGPTTSYPSPAQTQNVKSRIPSPMKSAPSSSSTKAPRVKDGEADSGFLVPPTEQTPAPWSKRRERVSTQLSTEALDRESVTPTLSEDCVITYAPAGYFRNVRAAKEQVFDEEGVVMGARFIVGG